MAEQSILSMAQVCEAAPLLSSPTSTHARGPEDALPITAEMLPTQRDLYLVRASQAAMCSRDKELGIKQPLRLPAHAGRSASSQTDCLTQREGRPE